MGASRPLRRAAARERQAAALLGSRRVHRARGQSAPDIEPVTLPNGMRLMVEVKTRRKLPALIRKALEQARGYGRAGDVPCAVLSETGGEPIAALPLRALRVALGLEAPPSSGEVPLPAPLEELAGEERQVMAYLARRLLEGQRRYGALCLASDPRDFRKEQGEELADWLLYGAFEELKRTIR